MIPRLLAAWPLDRLQLWLAFGDGTEGAVDLEDHLGPRCLARLRDVREFRRLQLDRGRNILFWPSGVELHAGAPYRTLRQSENGSSAQRR